MTELTRKQFLGLTGLDRATFDSRARRDQFPFLNGDLIDVAERVAGDEARYRMYTASEAFFTLISDTLNKQCSMPLRDACNLAVRLTDFFRPCWAALRESSLALLAGREFEPILCGSFSYKSVKNFIIPQPVCDTLSNIAANKKFWPPILAVSLISLTELAADLHVRAAKFEVDLEEFWGAR